MNPKAEFLYKLIVQIEYAEKAARAKPHEGALHDFAGSLRAVYESLARFPAHHPFFEHLADCQWRPQTLCAAASPSNPLRQNQCRSVAAA